LIEFGIKDEHKLLLRNFVFFFKGMGKEVFCLRARSRFNKKKLPQLLYDLMGFDMKVLHVLLIAGELKDL
jgi:hypothetical protein